MYDRKREYYECIENIYLREFGCIPNPFTEEEFVLLIANNKLKKFCKIQIFTRNKPKNSVFFAKIPKNT